MNVPGSNILAIALRAVSPTQNVWIKEFIGNTQNEFGSTVSTYSEPKRLRQCSVQPVPFRDVQQMGLTVGKRYISVWLTGNAEGAYRGGEADVIIWNGAKYTVLEPTSWIEQDGWTVVIAVKERD